MSISIASVAMIAQDYVTQNFLRSQVWTTGSSSGFAFTHNAIGEYKHMQIIGNVSGGTLNDREFRYVPGLFVLNNQTSGLNTGAVPNCYRWYITSGTPTSTPLPALVDSSLFAPQNNRMLNDIVTFTKISDTEFHVDHYFFVTYDDDMWWPAYGDNHSRFLKSKYSDATELLPSTTSVFYYAKKAVGIFFQLRDPVTNVAEFTERTIPFKAAWYADGDWGGTPDFENPVFTVKRSAVTYNYLSASLDNNVTFNVDSNITGNVDVVMLYIIRTDAANNDVTFPVNYSLGAVIDSYSYGSAAISPLGGALFGPAPIGGSTFQVGADALAAALVSGGKYRFMAVVYDTGYGDACTSFISDEYECTAAIPYAGGGWSDRLQVRDYHKIYDKGKLKCTVEERLRLTLDLAYPFNQWANNINTRLGLTVPNDMRRYLTQVRLLAYERRTDQAGVLYVTDRRDVLADITLPQSGTGTYPTIDGASFTAGLDAAALSWDLRVRYEAHIQNLYTLYDGVAQPVPLSNQEWGGRIITLEVQLEFYYDDYSTPFTDRVIYQTQLDVRDYVTTGGGVERILTIDNERVVCAGSETCFTAHLTLTPPQYWRLITTLEPLNGYYSTVKENEVYAPGILPQQVNVAVVSQDTDYAGGDAGFCIDTGVLLVGVTYKVSALAKYMEPGKTFVDSSFDDSFN